MLITCHSVLPCSKGFRAETSQADADNSAGDGLGIRIETRCQDPIPNSLFSILFFCVERFSLKLLEITRQGISLVGGPHLMFTTSCLLFTCTEHFLGHFKPFMLWHVCDFCRCRFTYAQVGHSHLPVFDLRQTLTS